MPVLEMYDKMKAKCAAVKVDSGGKSWIDGACALTDADGRAKLPRETAGWIVAESESARGVIALGGGTRRAEIVLWPKRSVVAEVVDGEGRLLEGVPVCVRMMQANGHTARDF